MTNRELVAQHYTKGSPEEGEMRRACPHCDEITRVEIKIDFAPDGNSMSHRLTKRCEHFEEYSCGDWYIMFEEHCDDERCPCHIDDRD